MATKHVTIPGDPRPYIRYKPDGDHRYHVRCLATEDHDDIVWECSFSQREDKFKSFAGRDKSHKCTFKNPAQRTRGQTTLDRLHIHRAFPGPFEISPIAEDIARFVGRANISINAVCQGDLHSLLVRVFKEGWNASSSPATDAETAAVKCIPRCTRAMMATAIKRVSQKARDELIAIFSQYNYIGLSIDGVTISSRKFLNVDVVHPASKTYPFTYDFLTSSDLDTAQFVNIFGQMLSGMTHQGLRVGGVTSDGCSFQRKGLDWTDPQSIQFKNPEFSKVLFVPCICHRIQNSICDLFKSNSTYRRLVSGAREIAVFLRKPKNREVLGAICPAYCATRWIYDYPLVRFIFNRRDMISELFEEIDFELIAEIEILIPLLEKVFVTVRDFEADHANCAEVYPKIKELLKYLESHALAFDRPDWREMYSECASILLQRTLGTSNHFFQLAYVLTPSGRNDVRTASLHQIMEESPPLEQIRELVDLEVQNLAESVGMFQEGISPGTEDDDDEPIPPQMLLDELSDPPLPEEFEEDVNDPEQTTVVWPAVSIQTTTLGADAELGLRQVLAQYHVSPDELQDTIGAFQAFVSVAANDLFMKPIPGIDRYSWAVACHQSEWKILADIALRIEALVCNEAVSERTNSAMRRVLAPFRLKMGHDALLSRLTIAKHRNQGSEPITAPERSSMEK